MSFSSTSSIVGGVIGVLFALLSIGMGRAPGWRSLWWFAAISLTAGGFCFANAIASLDVSDTTVVLGSQATLVFAGLHGCAWLLYRSASNGTALSRFDRGLIALLSACALAALAPGLALTGRVEHHRVEWLATTYNDAVPSHVGEAVFAVFCLGLAIPLWRYFADWRAGVPGAAPHAFGLGCLLLGGANDALAASGRIATPYLLDLSFIGLIVAVGFSMTARFVESARALDALSGELERAVEERSRELATTEQALSRAEKLAALGQLAAGVAHEINNPSAAVVANLSYLREHLNAGLPLPDDARDCIDESLTSLGRIARIVRQLLDAGSVAGSRPLTLAPVDIARAVHAAVATSRPSIDASVHISIAVAHDLCASGEAHLVEQVLANLVLNAGQAIGAAQATGHVSVTAERQGSTVVVRVTDDGPGIAPGMESRIFEPFFSTKGVGKGAGLGLAVSRGIVRSLGGALAVESTSAGGTTMRVDLLACELGAAERAQSILPEAPARLRVLVVDDDGAVRTALARQLAGSFDVETADGVASAIERISSAAKQVDAILCDLLMPDGGGERLFSLLSSTHPSLAARMIFLSGGGMTADERRFLEAQGSRALTKPLELRVFERLARQLCAVRGDDSAAPTETPRDAPVARR